MPRLALPLTVRTGDGPVDVVIHAAGPVPWSQAHPLVLRAAGLPAGTPLHWGVGPVQPDWRLGSPPLLAGTLLDVAPADRPADEPPVVLAVLAGPDAGRWIPLTTRPVVVGRDPGADLALTDPQVSFRHLLLRPTTTGLSVTDLGSTNGVRVDGEPATAPRAAAAATGCLIRIGGTLLQVQLTVEPVGPLTPDRAGHLIHPGGTPPPAPTSPPIPADPGPPPRRQRRPVPIVAALLGAATGGCLALVLRSPVYLAFAALGPVTMLGSAASDRLAGRRSHRRTLAEHRNAVADRAAAVAMAVAADRRRRWALWPDPATLVRRARVGGAGLWDRRPGDEAYLQVAVGSGTAVLAGVRASPSPPAGTVTDVPVTDIPVTVDLPGAGVLGMAGAGARPLARWLVLQIAALHSPADVALVLLAPGRDLRPARDLPHVPGRPGAADARSPAPRQAPAGPDRGPIVDLPVIGDIAGVAARDVVVVLDGSAAIRSTAGRALLAVARSAHDAADRGDGGTRGAGPAAPRIHVLCLADNPDDLPAGCVGLIVAHRGAAGRTAVGSVGARTGGGAPAASASTGTIDVTGIDADQFATACRALAPLLDGSGRTQGVLPPSVPLLDLIGPVTPEDLRRRWIDPRATAVLGVGPNGVAAIDLDADGPHLLIAGTTGSGKSELLQTLVAALAVASPPGALTFLLVDYKGGAAFAAIAALPHVVGVVTDLDPALSARALASLRAELRRRERCDAAGGPRPAKLVIVVDEFATLAAELPEFLAGLLDVAQRGRSLGLHLVLATQRPAGVVSPAMRANISARICLRVTDAADSLDVVGVPDGCRISPRTPGRAVLRTGAGLVAFQAAQLDTPVAPDLLVRRRDEEATAPELRRDPAGPPTGAHVLVEAALGASTGRPPPPRPWVPPLPARFRPGPEHPDVLALADLPDQQTRRALPLPQTSVLVTGPAGSGRSTALRRIAGIAAARGAELFVVDAAGSLADLRRWPVVSSHLTLADPRLILRLLMLLADPARRPADGRTRWLVVDGYDLVAAALDRADFVTGSAALGELPGRAAGTVLLAASGPPSLRHQRHGAAFPAVIALGTEDGATAGPVPPGRGRWSEVLVQFADAPPGFGPAAAAPGHPTGHRQPGEVRPGGRKGAFVDALEVRPLPDVVTASQLPAARPDAIPLGLGGDDATALTIDLQRTTGAIVVAGPRRSGVSTALAVIAGGAARAGIPVLLAETGPAAQPGTAGVTTLDLRAGVEPLRAALAAHAGPLLVVVDQHGRGATHPAAELLERLCQVCGPGQHLLLGERVEALAHAPRGHLAAALAFRRGLLLAPDVPDGALLDVALPRRAGAVPAGRGFWVDAGSATPVQVTAPSRPDESSTC